MVPVEEELEVFREAFKEAIKLGLPKRALTLGATNELRDIALDHGHKSYAVDISQAAIDRLSEIMKHQNHPHDIVKKGDWLKIKFKDGFFGVVMGDASFMNLSTKEDNKKLAKMVKKVLAPKGFLVTRNVIFPKEHKHTPIKELVELYRSKKISFGDFYCHVYICAFEDEAYDKKTCQYNTKKACDLIDKAHFRDILNKKEHDFFVFLRHNVTRTVYPEKEFIALIESNGFKLRKRFVAKQCLFHRYLPTYVFQRA